MGQNGAFFPKCGVNIAFRIHCNMLQSLYCFVQIGKKEGRKYATSNLCIILYRLGGRKEGSVLCASEFALHCTGWKERRKEGVKNDVKRKNLFLMMMMMMSVSAHKAIVYCTLAFVYTTYCRCTPPSGTSPDAPPLFHLRYRFAEIYYRRGESSHKGRSSTTARVETTVLFLPDVWNVCPAKLEWDGLHLNYKHQLEKKLSCSTGATPQLDEQEGEEEENKALIRPFSSLRFYSLLADHLPVLPPSPLLQSQHLA